MKLVRSLALLLALSALVTTPAAARAASCEGADALPTAKTVKRAQTATLCLINKERSKRGVSTLRSERRLVKAAGGHSRDMVRRGYFDHVTPEDKDPGDRIAATGYRSSTWGENIAWGGGKLGTPASIVRNWMGSPGHRANILNGVFKESGIGIAVGDPDPSVKGFPAATYTQVFATPR